MSINSSVVRSFVQIVIFFVLFTARPALAQTIEIKNAWVRGTVAGQSVTGAFMEITSKMPARLLEVSSPTFTSVQLHNMTMEGGVMRMSPIVGGIDLRAGKSVKLEPGGYHIMLAGLEKPLKQGQRIAFKLTFELSDKQRRTLDVEAEVRNVQGAPNTHR